MLHRSLGVLASTPFQVSIACAKDLICNKVSTRFATQFSQIHDCFLHLNSTLTMKKTMQLRMFQLARLLHYGTKLLSCFSVSVWLFLSLTFFLHFHLLLLWCKNWRIWCCFEESIAVEERDLVQVEVPTGIGMFFCRFVPPLHSQNLCRNQAKDGRDLYNLIST